MTTAPIKKVEVLAGMMNAGDCLGALRLAASWPKLGEQEKAIRQGWAAESNPGFYRQIDKDPNALIAEGIAALKVRYSSYYTGA